VALGRVTTFVAGVHPKPPSPISDSEKFFSRCTCGSKNECKKHKRQRSFRTAKGSTQVYTVDEPKISSAFPEVLTSSVNLLLFWSNNMNGEDRNMRDANANTSKLKKLRVSFAFVPKKLS
jgi:hypothetical protein